VCCKSKNDQEVRPEIQELLPRSESSV
jgi:hypothetical protein